MPQKIPWPIQPRIKCLPRNLKFSIPLTPMPFIHSRMVRVSSPNLLNRPNILSLSRHLAGRLRFHRRTPNITMTLPRHHHYHRISLYFPILLRHPSSHHGPWALALRGTHVSPSLYLFAKIPLLQTSSWRRRFPSLEAQVHRHPQQYRMHNTPHTPRGCFIYPCEWLMNHHGNGRLTLCLSTHTIRYTCILFSKMHLAIQLRLLSERISASSPLPLRSLFSSERNRSCIQISNIISLHLWQCTVQ